MPNVTKSQSNNFVSVSYPVREAVLEITHAEHDLILMFSHEKVKMIKFIRAQYNLGLYDAKQVVDTVIGSAENDANKNKYEDTDWSKVTPGTVIYVRDSEQESWRAREFLAYDTYKYYKFICNDVLGGTVGWKYAQIGIEL